MKATVTASAKQLSEIGIERDIHGEKVTINKQWGDGWCEIEISHTHFKDIKEKYDVPSHFLKKDRPVMVVGMCGPVGKTTVMQRAIEIATRDAGVDPIVIDTPSFLDSTKERGLTITLDESFWIDDAFITEREVYEQRGVIPPFYGKNRWKNKLKKNRVGKKI